MGNAINHRMNEVPDCAERSPCALVGRINGVFNATAAIDNAGSPDRPADLGVVGRGVNHGDYFQYNARTQYATKAKQQGWGFFTSAGPCLRPDAVPGRAPAADVGRGVAPERLAGRANGFSSPLWNEHTAEK